MSGFRANNIVEGQVVLAQAGETELHSLPLAPPVTIVPFPPAQLITEGQQNVAPSVTAPAATPRGARSQPIVTEQGLGLVGEPLPASGGRGPTLETVRSGFFSRRDAVANGFMQRHGMTREQAEYAADQWVARNVARWQNQRAQQRGDGLRVLTAAGMLIAIAQEGVSVDPKLLAAAHEVRAQVRDQMVGAGMSAEQADRYLANLGQRVHQSTTGWGIQLRNLRESAEYRSFEPQAPEQRSEVRPFDPAATRRPPSEQHARTAQADNALEAARKELAAAGNDYARRLQDRATADVRAHLANLEAQGRPVGGPKSA